MLTDDLEKQARRRAGAKMGWYIHATVYVAVNALLAMISAMSSHAWAFFPAAGWGIGLAIHGLVVFGRTSGLRERMVAEERRRLLQERERLQ
ncbi:2TM domain-containing protein [Ramlibacter sp. G-1-2-2]|uniref:2TM domain-containing protein n=1 Tax=Ramlibacter agri TaxID=2728837 RepID=A0A848H3D5_9BURK|nr:2TM domain-containing protein [Ramlibacter agri]NML45007.1 2TM domain-containing protein [Ramlibacter agri]